MQHWIKVRTNLAADPRIVSVAARLQASKPTIVGACVMLWSIADQFTTNGKLAGYSAAAVDEAVGLPGFADALAAVGWLKVEENAVTVPEFQKHNGQSAKRRAQDAARKNNVRKKSATKADGLRTTCGPESETKKSERRNSGLTDRLELSFSESDARARATTLLELCPALKKQDREFVAKVALLSTTNGFSEAWLADGMQAVRVKKPVSPLAYLRQVLRESAKQLNRDFEADLSRVQIPDGFDRRTPGGLKP